MAILGKKPGQSAPYFNLGLSLGLASGGDDGTQPFMLRKTLDNGLKILVEPNHASAVVAVQIWVGVGSADEQGDDAGLAHVHEHMLFKGTERRKVGEIAADVEAAGGDINAWTSFDQTVYHVTIASRELDVALDILADAVQNSAFDAEELKRELEVVLEELRRGNDTPGRVASEMLFGKAYSAHTYGRPVIGYVDTVQKFSREQILRFYKKWYQPSNMTLVVVGDVDEAAVVKKAEALFSGRDNSSIERTIRPKEPPQTELRTVKKSQDIQETHMLLTWHATRLHDDDTAAMDVLSTLLGAGESARLYKRVKREADLVNDCYAYSYTPQDPGLFVVGAQIHGGGIEAAFRALLKETMLIQYEAPDPKEIEKAKTIILSEAVYQKETVQGTARKIGYFELVAGGAEYEKNYYDGVREVTPEDVQRVAKTYLGPTQLTVSTLSPTAYASAMEESAVKKCVSEVEQELKEAYQGPTIELGPLQVAKVKLQNGATLLVREDRAVPLVSIRAVAAGGLLAETKSNNGISHLLSELMVRGTTKYSAEQIIEETDAMAGSISGMSGRNSMGLRGDFLADSWDRGFELFASCLLEPTFPEDEIEKEKKTQTADIASRLDQLSSVAFDQFATVLYGDHPYALPRIGTAESVAGLGRDQIAKTFTDHLRPEGLTYCVVGAVDVARTVALVQKRIGSESRLADASPFTLPREPGKFEGTPELTIARDKEQAHLVMGFRGASISDDRRYALDVLSSVLGGQSGRLFLELRDKQSLAYSVTAFSIEGLHAGYFAVYIGTAPDKLATAQDGMRLELRRVLDEEVGAEELGRAHRYLIGSHEIALQRASARASTMVLNEAYGIGYDDHTNYARQIEAVTPQRLREVAREVIRFDAYATSIVAPA